MTRLEKAYEMCPDGIAYTVSGNNVKITDCCPYFLDCGDDDLDEATKVGTYGNIKGCRGITCETCWDKEYS